MIFFLPLYLQNAYGFEPRAAGIAMIPFALPMVLDAISRKVRWSCCRFRRPTATRPCSPMLAALSSTVHQTATPRSGSGSTAASAHLARIEITVTLQESLGKISDFAMASDAKVEWPDLCAARAHCRWCLARINAFCNRSAERGCKWPPLSYGRNAFLQY